MDRRLAWVAHSVDAVYSLLDKDPFILKNIDLSPFVHTPLHEAAVLGKIDIALELMILMPSFASKLNTRGFSPLHLAVENHHVEIAIEFIRLYPHLVRLRGRGGVTPLHVVAEKGYVDLLTEFLMASPGCIMDLNVRGETALHIAVLNGKYEELKLLIGWIQRMNQSDAGIMETEVLNQKDRDGNTVLHVAAYENNHQAVKSLLQCVSLDRNIQNKDGLTPLDLLRSNGPYMDKETENLIKKSGGKSKAALSKDKMSSELLRSPVSFWEFCFITMLRYRRSISDGKRNAILVITALVITTTYATALQPPGLKHRTDAMLLRCLWAFNTLAFVLALFLTSILIPPGRVYFWCYIIIAVPLFCSYGIAIYINTYDKTHVYIPFVIMVTAVIGFPSYLLFIYVKWKRSLQIKIFKSKTEMISTIL